MATFLFVMASVALLAGFVGLVAGGIPRATRRPRGARGARDEAAAKPPRPL
jgi:hypothetical protein